MFNQVLFSYIVLMRCNFSNSNFNLLVTFTILFLDQYKAFSASMCYKRYMSFNNNNNNKTT